MLLVALAIGILTILYRALIPDILFYVLIAFANILIVAAIIIDATKRRRMREDYNSQIAASSKSKAARAEQKRLRALERERIRKAAESEPEKVNEDEMSFTERLIYRAHESARNANIKGSGL